MSTVFVGGPFKAIVDPETGLVNAHHRVRLEALIGFFEAKGWSVLNAHREEGWGGGMVTAGECTGRDWRWMNECDLFVALPGDPASPGTHVELGWASALRRPIIVVTEPGQQVADLVTGLGGITDARYAVWTDDSVFADLAEAVRSFKLDVRSVAASSGV